MLRIAVQSKGRLFDDTMALLNEADIKISTSKRTLLTQASNFPVEVLFLRDDDIPQTIASGVADIGIVGENEFTERNEKADLIYRLGFSKCRLSLAIHKEEPYEGLSWFEGKKIATSYPGILRSFLDKNNIRADIHVITGSVVMKSEAVLIGYPGLSEEKKEILSQLLFRIEAVKAAEEKKYVLMNAPTDKVQEIIEVLPGIKSPTIMPLATEGWSSVHTVLDQKCFWEIIGKLKALGAQGILVLPIEKMIL